jgi:glycosyltransferase involved in cell wall biosynthesis
MIMSASNSLFFSIIMPTYERPKQIGRCLQALMQLDYPRDRFEAIVVDDGTKTPLDNVLSTFVGQLNLLLLGQKNAALAAARNTGARHAKGDVLVFIDDDWAPVPDYLTRLARRFAVTPHCAIGGRTINALTSNLYATASQIMPIPPDA